jgi:drug/metabolite transporter (DMT)-like permease
MAVGLLSAVLAAACYECGYVLQAVEARSAPAEDILGPSLIVRLAARRRWLAGTTLTLLGAGFQIVALALAPVTLVQPVLALGLVALLLLARSQLGEHLGALEVTGAAAVIAGVAAVGIASPGRTSGVTSVAALVLLLAPFAALTLLPFAYPRAPLGLAVAGAASGDALAAVALKLTANAAALGRPGLALLAAAGAAVAGALALIAEMSALRGLPASRVAPVVLSAQVVVPAVAGMVAFGEPAGAGVVLGIAAVGVGAGLLGASGAIAGLRGAGRPQSEALAHHGRGARQGAERVAR